MTLNTRMLVAAVALSFIGGCLNTGCQSTAQGITKELAAFQAGMHAGQSRNGSVSNDLLGLTDAEGNPLRGSVQLPSIHGKDVEVYYVKLPDGTIELRIKTSATAPIEAMFAGGGHLYDKEIDFNTFLLLQALQRVDRVAEPFLPIAANLAQAKAAQSNPPPREPEAPPEDRIMSLLTRLKEAGFFRSE